MNAAKIEQFRALTDVARKYHSGRKSCPDDLTGLVKAMLKVDPTIGFNTVEHVLNGLQVLEPESWWTPEDGAPNIHRDDKAKALIVESRGGA